MIIYLPPSLKQYELTWPPQDTEAGACALLFDIVYHLQPALTVCVNTINPASFFTASQAIAKSECDGIIYAATNWLSEDKFLEIQKLARKHHPSISYMMREPAQDSLRHFAKQSIDCIVIQDTNLSDIELNQLSTAWMKKLNDDGLLILQHQSNYKPSSAAPVRSQLTLENDTLTIISKNPTPNKAINELFELINTGNGQEFYRHLQHHIQNKNKISKMERNQLINQIKKQLSVQNT